MVPSAIVHVRMGEKGYGEYWPAGLQNLPKTREALSGIQQRRHRHGSKWRYSAGNPSTTIEGG